MTAVADILVVVITSEHLAEAVAVALGAARLSILIVEDVLVAVVAVRDVLAVLGVVVVTVGVIRRVGGSSNNNWLDDGSGLDGAESFELELLRGSWSHDGMGGVSRGVGMGSVIERVLVLS